MIAIHSPFPKTNPGNSGATLREISGLDYICNLLLAACHAALGDTEAAQDCVRALQAEVPGVGLSRIGVLRSFRRPEDGLKLREALRQAGLPEE